MNQRHSSAPFQQAFQAAAPSESEAQPALLYGTRQSRRAPSQQRYPDGTFRPDRPLPAGMSPRRLPDVVASSPRRLIARPQPAWYEDANAFAAAVASSTETTFRATFGRPHEQVLSPRVVPKRHQLKPSQMNEVLFGDPLYQTCSARAGTCATPAVTSEPRPQERMTDRQRVDTLKAKLRYEQRMTQIARNKLVTHLRRVPPPP